MGATETKNRDGRGDRFIATEHAVALILGEETHAGDAYPRILAAIGASLNWQFGGLWEPVPGPAAALECVEVWCSDSELLSPFAEESRGSRFPGVSARHQNGGVRPAPDGAVS